MIVLRSTPLRPDTADHVSPINALWYGQLPRTMPLPQLGHLFLIFPIEETMLTLADTKLDSKHYLLLHHSVTLKNLRSLENSSPLLILMISPGFIKMMADFLDIPADFNTLLHAVPLKKGDSISSLLDLLAKNIDTTEEANDIFMSIIGEILRLMRLRYEALLKLSQHKQNTIADILPRLLQARQFIEAEYSEAIKTEDVARYVALSEYHFARLFKTAFETTVHQYVLRLRLNQARYLLEANDSVTDVSLSVGYNSLSAFITAFRKYFGLTPSAYRAQFQN